ncbi:hypothetical protein Gohar_021378 [Gossypium harknessii]|uniref:Uncharacterized protein n=1 Tax=Gossypium harknessii TaxID=34285 RepID=A0A7J9IBP7_9ROSI|nr:hypothetical protein [Gossypium harknessii]
MTDLKRNIVDVPNPSGRGLRYRYFGAMTKLLGVKELFEKPSELRKRRARYDIYMSTNASYYGYRDKEDGILARVEGPTEAKMRTEAEEEWRRVEEIKREVNEVISVEVLRERFCLRKKRM